MLAVLLLSPGVSWVSFCCTESTAPGHHSWPAHNVDTPSPFRFVVVAVLPLEALKKVQLLLLLFEAMFVREKNQERKNKATYSVRFGDGDTGSFLSMRHLKHEERLPKFSNPQCAQFQGFGSALSLSFFHGGT